MCTYFSGLCKILRVNPKSYVDDVVKAFEKASDEKKSKCLEFLLGNHPIELLHPYTKEWKAKLEEMELGCDAPDENDNDVKTEVLDWIEEEEDDDDDDVVIDGDVNDEEEGEEEEDYDAEYWEDEFKKAVNSNEEMEVVARRSVKMTTKLYEKQSRVMEERRKTKEEEMEGEDELEKRGGRAKVSPEEWKQLGYGPRMKKIKKSRIPPGQFLRAAVRPFLYKNLVKEIVLTRHAIVEGEIGSGKKKKL